jgi:hypothetical protein
VIIWNPSWSLSEEGSSFLGSINETGFSADHDAVSVFWILNTRLPALKRFAYLPMPAYKDNFCVISEQHLLEAVLRTKGVDKQIRAKLITVFGVQSNAKAKCQTHPGELFRKLFLYGKKTNYDRLSCVATPSDPSNESIPGLINLDELPCGEQLGALETEDAKSEAYKKAKLTLKEAIKEEVLKKAQARTRKYVLSGTLLTDGHQLKIHAYSLVQLKKKNTNDLPSSSSEQKITSATNTKMKYLQAAIPNKKVLQDVFGYQDSFVVMAIDPGIKNTATAVVVDSISLKSWNLTLSKGSQCWNSQRHSKILRYMKSERKFQRNGESVNVNDLEASIRSMQLPDPLDTGADYLFSSLKDSYQDHSKSILEAERDLRSFYGSKRLKVMHYRKGQGELAEVGRAIGSMLKTTRNRAKIGNRRPMVIIGDGDFRCKTMNAIKSNRFISRLQSTVI